MDAIARHHAHMAELSQMGDHWHTKLWYGSGAWDGDPYLNIYHNAIRDEIEVRFEVPNRAPEPVFKIALADFDIDRLCAKLAEKDTRKKSHKQHAAEIEAHNDGIRTAEEIRDFERKQDFTEKMQWAINQDQGNNVRSIVVP